MSERSSIWNWKRRASFTSPGSRTRFIFCTSVISFTFRWAARLVTTVLDAGSLRQCAAAICRTNALNATNCDVCHDADGCVQARFHSSCIFGNHWWCLRQLQSEHPIRHPQRECTAAGNGDKEIVVDLHEQVERWRMCRRSPHKTPMANRRASWHENAPNSAPLLIVRKYARLPKLSRQSTIDDQVVPDYIRRGVGTQP